MSLSFLYSIFLHIFLLILLMFGFDYSKKTLPQEETILLELIPIDSITNVKTTLSNTIVNLEKPLQKSEKSYQNNDIDMKTNLNKDITAAIQSSIKEASTLQQVQKQVIKENTQSEDVKVENLPIKKEVKKKQLKEEKIVKSQPQKDKQIVDNHKKQKQNKEDVDEELAKSVLKSLKEGSKKVTKKQHTLDDLMDNAIKGDTTEDYKEEGNLSMSEISLIRSQISRAWRVTAFSGGKDNKQLKIAITIILERDGNIAELKVNKNKPKDVQSQIYSAFVDSVIRAVRSAAPLKNLPEDKFDTWHEMELVFDSSGMIY